MYINDRLNRLLRHYGLEEHEFYMGGGGSHTALDHLDIVAHACTAIFVAGARHSSPIFYVGNRVRAHEKIASGSESYSFWLGQDG